MFSNFFPMVWVRVNGLGAWTGAGGQRRENATRRESGFLFGFGGLLRRSRLSPPGRGCEVRVLLWLWPRIPRERVELMPVSS